MEKDCVSFPSYLKRSVPLTFLLSALSFDLRTLPFYQLGHHLIA
jgi:hypothetical protein